MLRHNSGVRSMEDDAYCRGLYKYLNRVVGEYYRIMIKGRTEGTLLVTNPDPDI